MKNKQCNTLTKEGKKTFKERNYYINSIKID